MKLADPHWLPPEQWAGPDFLLRPWREGDGAALSEAAESSHEHLAPWMPWSKPEQGVEESEAIVRRLRGGWLTRDDFVVAVFSTDDSRVLGGTGFHLREGPRENGAAEMGMWIRASEAGSGLGTRVLEAMLEWGFSEWGWRRLSWRCDLRNVASVRVAEKAGLRREGTFRSYQKAVDGSWRDTACFALLREDWAAGQAGD